MGPARSSTLMPRAIRASAPSTSPIAAMIASLNRLIGEAQAPLIARMDGDDIAMPERFERQLAFLDAHPDYGVVGTSTHDIDEQGRLSPNSDFHPLDHASFVAVQEDGPLLCHPSVMMRRDLVREAGGYRAAFAHCEDYDLWLRPRRPHQIVQPARSPAALSPLGHAGQHRLCAAAADRRGGRLSRLARARRRPGRSNGGPGAIAAGRRIGPPVRPRRGSAGCAI